MIFRFFFKVFARFRNPSLFIHYCKLKESEKKSLKQLEFEQIEKLKNLLIFLNENNKFYRKVLENNKVDLQNFSLIEFHKIPVCSKNDLIQNNIDLITNYNFNKVFKCESSGTSGQVLTFVRNEEWDSFNRASIMRGYSWFGVNIWDFNIYFWGYNFKLLKKIKFRFSDFMMNRFRIFSFNSTSDFLLRFVLRRAKFIEGYSSMIYEMAKRSPELGFEVPNLLLVKGTSEKIYEHYHDYSKKAFGHKIVSEYGAAESGIIAFECKEGNMHINMEGVLVEIDKENEIIVTNLLSKSFPIIRYKLGDVVELESFEKKCNCGMVHPIIKEVTGRIGKLIYGQQFEYPSLVLYYIFKNIYFEKGLQLSYQAHQGAKGGLEIWIEDDIDKKTESIIYAEAFKYFKTDMVVSIKTKMNLRMEKGKLRDFVSKI
jgi:phenylacetate-CoA ligase